MSEIASAIFQAVWPIVDDTVPLSELYEEAADKLRDLAGLADVVITGPPVWSVSPAAEVIGWEAYAPGLVLVGKAPAERVEAPRLGRHGIDHVEVETAQLRNLVPRRAADRYELVRRLAEDEQRDYATISACTGLSHDAINQILTRINRRKVAA